MNEIEELKEMLMKYAMKLDVMTASKTEEKTQKNIIQYIGIIISILTFIFCVVKIYFTDLTDIKIRLTKVETKMEIQENKK